MIPISLTIKGLYSYQEEATIDFTRLNEAHLFGIFGPVGSGKSTILDAITFALYGKTDRLGSSGSLTNYNMMNLRSKELLIDFTFVAGVNNKTYRLVVSGKRNRRRFEDVKTFDRKMYEVAGDELKPLEDGDPESIIGLSYDNFRRTIIIPQGKFQEFLQLKSKDRTVMLRELFDLGRFELADRVGRLQKKNDMERSRLEGEIDNLGEVSVELIKELEESVAQLDKELETLNKSLTEKVDRETEMRRLKELFEKLNTCRQTLDELEKRRPEIDGLDKKVREFEGCQKTFGQLLRDRNRLQTEVNELRKDLESRKKDLDAEKAKLSEAEDGLKEATQAYESRDSLKQKGSDLEIVLDIRTVEQALGELRTRHSQMEADAASAEKKVAAKKKRDNRLSKDIAAQREAQVDTGILAAVQKWFGEQTACENAVAEANEEVAGAQEEKKAIESEKTALDLPEGLDTGGISLRELSFAELDECLAREEQSLNQRDRELAAREQKLSVSRELKNFSDSLNDGEPCPLCGAVEHPGANLESVDDDLRNCREQRREIDGRSQDIALLRRDVTKLTQRYESAAKALAKAQSNLAKKMEKSEKHRAGFAWDEYSADDSSTVDRLLAQASKAKKALQKLEKEQTTIRKELEKEEKKRDDARRSLEEVGREVVTKEAQRKEKLQQVKSLDYSDYAESSPDEIEVEAKVCLARVKQIESEYENARKVVNGLRDNVKTLEGVVSSGQKRLITQEGQFNKSVKALDDKVSASDYGSVEQVEAILAADIDTEAVRQEISDFRDALNAEKGSIKLLQDQAKGKQYDDKAHVALVSEIEELKGVLKERSDSRGARNQQLNDARENFKKREDALKRSETLKLRGENLKVLANMFRGSGFVNFVSSVYLQELCAASNERFANLTRKQLRLELEDDNSFRVRDFLNEGKTRSIKSLSGGQTFQASLCLALALVERLQQYNKSRQNFFFLDEGFGSQDAESLRLVFDTLKSLRKENRIVGVISHVDELKQEIGTYLEVANKEETGSEISQSWA